MISTHPTHRRRDMKKQISIVQVKRMVNAIVRMQARLKTMVDELNNSQAHHYRDDIRDARSKLDTLRFLLKRRMEEMERDTW